MRTAPAWLALILVATGGCRAGQATSAEQAASMRETLTAADRERVRAGDVGLRTAFVLTAAGLANASDQGRLAFRFRPGADIHCGAAAVVDRRGYLATVAHLVGREPIGVVTVADGRAVLRPARVVYRGEDESFDFAVLYVPGPLPAAFEWLPEAALTPGLPLIGLGANVSADEQAATFVTEPYAGRLTEVSRHPASDAPAMLVVGSLPTHAGDSGGPVFAVDGRLAGVLSAGAISWPGGRRQGEAVRPDLKWLAGLIENDQRTLAAAEIKPRPGPSDRAISESGAGR